MPAIPRRGHGISLTAYPPADILGNMPTENWTNLIRKALADTGLSLLAVARASEVGYATVHGFANGTRGLMLDNAERIGRVVGLELRRARRGK